VGSALVAGDKKRKNGRLNYWIPAFAGMTVELVYLRLCKNDNKENKKNRLEGA
jgi:hypothetical protein